MALCSRVKQLLRTQIGNAQHGRQRRRKQIVVSLPLANDFRFVREKLGYGQEESRHLDTGLFHEKISAHLQRLALASHSGYTDIAVLNQSRLQLESRRSINDTE